MDPRHQKRLKIVQNLFSYSFQKSNKLLTNKNLLFDDSQLTKLIIKNLNKIDRYIKKYADKYPLEKIAKLDLAILRLAIYELVIEPKEPKKVIVNEAIELAKEMAGERSFAFINGLLGKIIKNNYV